MGSTGPEPGKKNTSQLPKKTKSAADLVDLVSDFGVFCPEKKNDDLLPAGPSSLVYIYSHPSTSSFHTKIRVLKFCNNKT